MNRFSLARLRVYERAEVVLMSQHSLRNWMKYGPFTALYTHIRRIKRRLRQQPYQHIERFSPEPLPAADLREHIARYPDNARLYYSLALAYLEPIISRLRAAGEADSGEGRLGSPGAERLALACLRSAETLKMEASERIQLYRALVESRLGDAERAQRLAESLDPAELTPSESGLRETILRGSLHGMTSQTLDAALRWKQAGERIQNINPASILVIGDELAITATWAKEADYLLAAPNVTGLSLKCVASFRRQFSVCVGAPADHERARILGILCEEWVTISSEVSEGNY